MKRMSKSLLCGVIATSFFIINCQKAPNRPVTAATPPPGANKADTAAAGNCTPSIVTLITQQSTEVKELKALVDGIKDKNAPTDKEKADITAKNAELKATTDKLVGEIKAIKSADGKEGAACNQVSEDKDKAPTVQSIAALQDIQTRETVIASNAIKQRLAGSPEATLTQGASLMISAELADALKDDKNKSDLAQNKIGEKFILDGKLESSGSGNAAYTAAAGDDTKTLCVITLGDANVSSDTEVKILGTDTSKKLGNRDQVIISLQVQASAAPAEADASAAPAALPTLGLSCLTKKDAADKNVEARKALGDLVSEKPLATTGGATPAPDAAATPAPAPDAAATPAPAPDAAATPAPAPDAAATPAPAPDAAATPAPAPDAAATPAPAPMPVPAPAPAPTPSPVTSGDPTSGDPSRAQSGDPSAAARVGSSARAPQAAGQAMTILTRGH